MGDTLIFMTTETLPLYAQELLKKYLGDRFRQGHRKEIRYLTSEDVDILSADCPFR